MSENPHDGEERRALSALALPRARQIAVVAAILGAVLVVFLVLPAVSHLLFPPPPEASPPPDDGSFAATARQWSSLRFETVRPTSFRSEVVTDGRIATDDDRTTQVFSPFTGPVTRLYVKPGDRVARGTPLFAVAATEAAQSNADILSATAQLAAAKAEAARLHDLVQHQGAAQKDYDQARVDLANAEGALAAARGRRAALGPFGNGGEAVVRAPVAGVVIQRAIGPGQNIQGAGAGNPTQALTISDLSLVWVVGSLREDDALKAHIGQQAEVRLLAAPDQPLAARIDYVAPSLDAATRRLTVRATLANPGDRLKPEMFASFALATGPARTALSVPVAAVIYEGSTARVWLARSGDHRLALRYITAGATQDDRVEVLAGLKPGDVVVTQGALFIDRGARSD